MAVLIFEYVTFGTMLPLLVRELVLLREAQREERRALRDLDTMLRGQM